LQKLAAPVFALPIGAQAVKDLAIDKVMVDDFAFVRNQVTVDVTVTARGFTSTDVPLVVKREGQIVAQKTVRVGGGTQRAEVKLAFVPDRTGKFAFQISAPVYEGEALAQNHSRSFVLKVIRDRVRVVLAVIGGEQAFSASDFAGTAIEGVLPANLVSFGPPPIDETPAQLKLTEAGKRHPVTELVPGAGANEQAWSRLPKLPGLNTMGAV